jgi:DNA-binding response OmpR family regulator
METILIIEDDPTLRLALTKTLRSGGYRVETSSSGPEGLQHAMSVRPDLILLDIMLPGMNGYELCKTYRAHDASTPIIMLTAKGQEEDKVLGLGVGADDYVKPFGVSELLARVQAALRRSKVGKLKSDEAQIGCLWVDFVAHAAKRKGVPVEMSALEMKLLKYLLEHDGRVVARQQILDGVLGADYFGTDRTVDNFINRLRGKIECDVKHPCYLVTLRGAGYRLDSKGCGDGLL